MFLYSNTLYFSSNLKAAMTDLEFSGRCYKKKKRIELMPSSSLTLIVNITHKFIIEL